MGRAAAFFDLDKTLIEGSSAIHFGRAAYRAGMMSRRQLVRDLWANVRFRLQGSTDEGTEELKRRVLDSIAGRRVEELARLSPDVLAGVLPRLYPEMLAEAWSHQDAGRPVYIVTAASQELAEMLAHVVGFDGGIGFPSQVATIHVGSMSTTNFRHRVFAASFRGNRKTRETPSNLSAGSARSTAWPCGSRMPAFGRTSTVAFTRARAPGSRRSRRTIGR